MEFATYMMVFAWNYRDALASGSPEKVAVARKLLNDSYVAYAATANKITAQKNASLVVHAIEQGIEVVSHDVRERLPEPQEISAFQLAHPPETSFESMKTLKEQGLWCSMQAQQLCNAHPLYAHKLDTVQKAISLMQSRNIPTDVASATLASQLAIPGKNMITISGANHLNGVFHKGWAPKAFSTKHWPCIGKSKTFCYAAKRL